MKNGVIVVLLLGIGFLFVQNRLLQSEVSTHQLALNQSQRVVEKVQEQQERARSSWTATVEATATPSPTPNSGRLDELMREKAILQQQIRELTPASLDQQIQQRKVELGDLQSRLQSFQNTDRSNDESLAAATQFQRALSQEVQRLFDQRIQNQEKVIKTLRREKMIASDSVQTDREEMLYNLNTRLADEQEILSALNRQKQQAANDTLNNTMQLGATAGQAKAAVAQTRNAIQQQIARVEQDIQTLNSERARIQATVGQYQIELKQLNQMIQEQQRNVR